MENDDDKIIPIINMSFRKWLNKFENTLMAQTQNTSSVTSDQNVDGEEFSMKGLRDIVTERLRNMREL